MPVNSSSSASYLILDSLSDGSKYGLEIIEHITARTAGCYIMKKPTLYSCLTRLEKRGWISSSYWGDSDMGGKRHYYTITKEGRRALEDLSADFVNFDFSTLNTDESDDSASKNSAKGEKNANETFQDTFENNSEDNSEDKTVVLQQDNLFNFVNPAMPEGFLSKNAQTTENLRNTGTTLQSESATSASTTQNTISAQSTQPAQSEQSVQGENLSGAIENQMDIFSFQQNKATQDAIAAANEARKAAEDAQKALEETRLAAQQDKREYYQKMLEQTTNYENSNISSASQNGKQANGNTQNNALQNAGAQNSGVHDDSTYVDQKAPEYWDRMNTNPTPRPKPTFDDGGLFTSYGENDTAYGIANTNSGANLASNANFADNGKNLGGNNLNFAENSVTNSKNNSPVDDARFLEKDEKFVLTEEQLQQNQQIYNTSSELKKYRNRKSFSDNQIEMNVVYDNEEDKKIQSERLEQLKASLAQYKQSFSNQAEQADQPENSVSSNIFNNQTTYNGNNYVDQNNDFGSSQNNIGNNSNNSNNIQSCSIQSNSAQNSSSSSFGSIGANENRPAFSKNNNPILTDENFVPKDDAVFITSRVNENDIPVQKRITPPNIDVSVTADDLPAPRRNSNLEPTYKDVMSRLFERKAEANNKTTLYGSNKTTATQSTAQSTAQSTTRTATQTPAQTATAPETLQPNALQNTSQSAYQNSYQSKLRNTAQTSVQNFGNTPNAGTHNAIAQNSIVQRTPSVQQNSTIQQNLSAQQKGNIQQNIAAQQSTSVHQDETYAQQNTATQSATSAGAATAQAETYQPQAAGSFADYESLKKYYNGYGISFKEYKKSVVERTHNTNWLNFLSSALLLLLSGIGSAVIFGIVYATGHLAASSNFLYYTAPAIFLVYCIYAFVIHKILPSKKPNFAYGALVIWAIFALSLVVVFVANILCGMQYETISSFLTPMFVPSYAAFLALPVNYYTRKFLYKKFGK